jgi:hypothetical protein
MTICTNVPSQEKLVSWIKAGAVIGLVMVGVVATMILAVSNSAQSAQARSCRAERSEYRAVEAYLPWGGSQPALLL